MRAQRATLLIDTTACVVDLFMPTGATVILTSGSDRAMLTALGTIDALDVDAVPRGSVERARHLHLGAYFLQGPGRRRLPALFAAARDHLLTMGSRASLLLPLEEKIGDLHLRVGDHSAARQKEVWQGNHHGRLGRHQRYSSSRRSRHHR